MKENKIDFFICHASEDKEVFVRDLAQHLINYGANVFYDEFSIKLGDSLTQKINEGLQSANFGVVVLSNYFFEKKWTKAELQSIFNQSIYGDLKLLIIYHNIDNDIVRNEYPLLADIKATSSSKGYEKISDELFEAAGLTPQIGYITTLNVKENNRKIEDGFHILLRYSFPFKGEPRFSKVIYESGVPKKQNSRCRLVIKWNKRLYFEVVSTDYQTIGISADIETWKTNEPHIIIANFDPKNKLIFLMIDGVKVDEFKFEKFNLPDDFFNCGRGILGNSLELDSPAPFQTTGQSFGNSLNVEQAIKVNAIMDDFNKSIGR